MDRRGRCTAETEPQLLQARPAEDFAELAVAPPGVWACTAEGGRVKSWSPLLAATPPTAVPSPVRASPSSELSLPVPSFGTLSLLLSRASAECPSLCFYLCQDGQPLAGLGWCPWSRRCLASVLGAGLSRDETWFLKNHDFSSLWVWQRGAGGPAFRSRSGESLPGCCPLPGLRMGSGKCVRQTRMCRAAGVGPGGSPGLGGGFSGACEFSDVSEADCTRDSPEIHFSTFSIML